MKDDVEQEHVLLGGVVFGGMHGKEGRGQVGDCAFRDESLPDPGVWVSRLLARQGQRTQSLPGRDCAHLRVGSDQAVQRGRAGPLEAGDHDDAAEVDLPYLRVYADQLLDPQARCQRALDPPLLDEAAQGCEVGLLVDRTDEHGQWLDEPLVAEAGEPRPPPGPCDHRVDVELPGQPEMAARPADRVQERDGKRPVRPLVVRRCLGNPLRHRLTGEAPGVRAA